MFGQGGGLPGAQGWSRTLLGAQKHLLTASVGIRNNSVTLFASVSVIWRVHVKAAAESLSDKLLWKKHILSRGSAGIQKGCVRGNAGEKVSVLTCVRLLQVLCLFPLDCGHVISTCRTQRERWIHAHIHTHTRGGSGGAPVCSLALTGWGAHWSSGTTSCSAELSAVPPPPPLSSHLSLALYCRSSSGSYCLPQTSPAPPQQWAQHFQLICGLNSTLDFSWWEFLSHPGVLTYNTVWTYRKRGERWAAHRERPHRRWSKPACSSKGLNGLYLTKTVLILGML